MCGPEENIVIHIYKKPVNEGAFYTFTLRTENRMLLGVGYRNSSESEEPRLSGVRELGRVPGSI